MRITRNGEDVSGLLLRMKKCPNLPLRTTSIRGERRPSVEGTIRNILGVVDNICNCPVCSCFESPNRDRIPIIWYAINQKRGVFDTYFIDIGGIIRDNLNIRYCVCNLLNLCFDFIVALIKERSCKYVAMRSFKAEFRMEGLPFRRAEGREACGRGKDCKSKELFCCRIFSSIKVINSWLFLARRYRI